MPKERTIDVYNALFEAGKDYGIDDFGTYALNSMRMEKGFRAWGAEVGYDFLYNLHLVSMIQS